MRLKDLRAISAGEKLNVEASINGARLAMEDLPPNVLADLIREAAATLPHETRKKLGQDIERQAWHEQEP